MRSGLPPSLWLVGVPFALYAVGLAVVSALVPYAPALDDPEWLALARHFADTGTLDPEGLFRRVPLWQILLAASTSLLGDRSGVVLLQAASVLTVFVVLAHRAREGRATVGSTAAVACVFALSPQALLYSRHAANELFVGALSVLVLVLAERARGRRAVAVGALVGCAAMTKLAAAALALPAVWLLRGRGDTGRSLVAFSAGVVLVVVPLASLALLASTVHSEFRVSVAPLESVATVTSGYPSFFVHADILSGSAASPVVSATPFHRSSDTVLPYLCCER